MAMQRHVENSGEKGELVPDESPLMDALVSYSRFIDELFDQPRNHAMAMEYSVGKIAVRSVGRVLYKLRHSGAEDQPPLSLIARLSEKLVNIVSEIGNHPRRILQRKRSMEPVNRFRELDSSCVRWLIRQPGISIVEKAGHRRQILAVQRYESTNTLENRVFIDLLIRCRKLANDYLRQYGEKFGQHSRVKKTKRFKQVCEKFIGTGDLEGVQALDSLPQPNYVLLHEPRYHEVWLAYQKVMRQQARRKRLWTNRQSIWSEMCTLAIWNGLSLLARNRINGSFEKSHRCDLWIRDEVFDSGFIDWRSCPSDWQISEELKVAVFPAKENIIGKRFAGGPEEADCSIAVISNGNQLKSLVNGRFELPVNDLESHFVGFRLSSDLSAESLSVPVDLVKNGGFFVDKIQKLVFDEYSR